MQNKYSFKDYDNAAFYHSAAWHKVSAAYMASRHYICERCGKPATICHHKVWLNAENVHDPTIALNPDNLEALCQDCHNAEHSLQHSATVFNKDGTIKTVKESQELKEFERQRQAAADLMKRLQGNDSAEGPTRPV